MMQDVRDLHHDIAHMLLLTRQPLPYTFTQLRFSLHPMVVYNRLHLSDKAPICTSLGLNSLF